MTLMPNYRAGGDFGTACWIPLPRRASPRRLAIQIARAFTTVAAIVTAACAFAGQERPVDDFPVAELQNLDGSRSLFHLHSPYGFVAIWDHGKATFHLYDKARTNIATTNDLTTFVGLLSGLRDGSEVAWVNTCAAPLHYGMPKNQLSQIQRVLEKKKFKMAGIEENNFILCTCYPATNLIFFTNAPPNRGSTKLSRGQSHSAYFGYSAVHSSG